MVVSAGKVADLQRVGIALKSGKILQIYLIRHPPRLCARFLGLQSSRVEAYEIVGCYIIVIQEELHSPSGIESQDFDLPRARSQPSTFEMSLPSICMDTSSIGCVVMGQQVV